MNNFAQRWLFSTNHKCDAMHAIIAGSNRAGTTGAKPHATQPKVSRRVMSCVGVDGLVSLGKRILTMRPPFLWSVGGFLPTAYECRSHPNILLCGEKGASLRTGTKRSYCGDATSSPDALGKTSHSARFRDDGGEGGAGSRPRMSCKPHANGGRDSDSTENRSGNEPPAVTVHMDGGGWRRKLETLERNEKSGKFENIYSICTDPNFLIAAYEQIKSHTGNMTPEGGEERENLFLRRVASPLESLDRAWFFRTAELLRSEQFRFKPARRIMIPTPNKPREFRPLTIGSDNIVQQAMKIVMEHIYEPRFLDTSHGFRPGRGCHSGLEQICLKWTGASWFLEFDIKRCFNSMDRHKLVFILQKDIEDQRWMDLVHKLFTAGLVGGELGRPDPLQGSVLSRWSSPPWALAPLLCNIYLHELDQEVAKMANELSRSRKRRVDKRTTAATRTPITKAFRALTPQAEIMRVRRKAARGLSPTDRKDPNYARAFYVRYAGNFLVGIAGPRELVVTVKSRIVQFVNSELHLELTGGSISHISAESVKFLGMEIKVVPSSKLRRRFGKAMEKRRRVRNRIFTLKVQKRKRQDSLVHDALVRALGKLSRKQNSAGLAKLLSPKYPEMAELAQALLREMRADNELVTDIRDSQKNFHLALASRLDFAPDEAREAMDNLERKLDKWCDECEVRTPFEKDREKARREHVGRYEALPLQILAPLKEIRKRLKLRGLITENNKPCCVVRLIQLNDEDIVLWFNSVARDLLNYYRCCANFYKVRDYVDYFLRWSLIHTMAGKHKTSATKLIRALSIDMVIKNDEGEKIISFLSSNEIRRMGRMFLRGIPCGSDMRTLDRIYATFRRSRALRCSVKGRFEDKVEMHHVRKRHLDAFGRITVVTKKNKRGYGNGCVQGCHK